MSHISAVLLLLFTLSACVAGVESQEEETYSYEELPKQEQPANPDFGDRGPDPEACTSVYREGIAGQLMEIPVECHPFVIDPYSEISNTHEGEEEVMNTHVVDVQ